MKTRGIIEERSAMGICLSESTTIKDLLDHYPFLLTLFIDIGLMCVGCPADAFHDLADVARAYGLDKNRLILRLETAIDETINATSPR